MPPLLILAKIIQYDRAEVKINVDTAPCVVYTYERMVTKTIQVRSFPEDLLRRLRIEMVKRDMTLGQILAVAAGEFLRKGRNGSKIKKES